MTTPSRPSVIPIRLPDASTGSGFSRPLLNELVAYYELPVNKIVQIALRHLHVAVFPHRYARGENYAYVRELARMGGIPHTVEEDREFAEDMFLTSAQVEAKRRLSADTHVRNIGDFLAAHTDTGPAED